MVKKAYRISVLAVGLVTWSLVASSSQAADGVALQQAAIVCDSSQPSYVQYAVEELAGYLKESTGREVPRIAATDDKTAVQILVGAETVRALFPQELPAPKLGDEAYLLKVATKGSTTYVIAAGVTPRGTKLALGNLMKAIYVEGNSAFLPASLSVACKPAYGVRGMHLNGWALKYPYSFRSWREEDWYRYLDLLAYQGVNLFYLWPFMEIMPVPLSPEEQAYLEECRRVVDYAQKKHGMEVWIMQCTNRVAQDRCGVADPRLRPYWRPSQKDLNPANPEDFKAILESREVLYRIINNADGVCNIDSDPGFCPNSPVEDYVKVLQACRKLIDRHNIHGTQTKLINWMLWGWGKPGVGHMDGLAELEARTVKAVKAGLPEPLWLISGQFPEYLPICRQEGLISKTLYLPYGMIECEPAYPHTGVQIDAIRNMYGGTDASSPDIAGIMGNVQTPLLQFPNLFFFTSAWCDSAYRNRSEKDVLLDLAGHLYPDRKELVADCYLALKEPDLAKVESLANQLDDAIQHDKLGRPGVFGRKLFPDYRVVATSVVLQLRLRAAQERLLRGIEPATPQAECARLLADYFDAYLAWDYANGWHELWGWQAWPLGGVGLEHAIARSVRKVLATDADVSACFEEVARGLSAKHEAKIVEQGCIAPVKAAVLALEAAER